MPVVTHRVLLATWLLCFARAAHADSGELSLTATHDLEWQRLTHPFHDPDQPATCLQMVLPRFGMSITYGLHNRLRMGLATRLSLPIWRQPPAPNVKGWPATNTSVLARYNDLLSTAQVGLVLLDGDRWSIDLVAEGGVSLRHWRAVKTHAPRERDVPLSVTNSPVPLDQWKHAPYLRAAAGVRFRPLAHLSFALSPYVASTFARDLAVGGTFDLSVPFGAGPGL